MMKRDSPMHRDLTGFRLHCVAEGKSPATVRWYGQKLRMFAQYLKTRHSIDNVAQVKPG